ncbi:acyltransferase [Candidatus Albibeggiatoa sp. nov. NOAA]|uniref:acyltransferase n=1 Tax=Candidatus Albibeggiatoa sp. nov. NOAA TaxID=3162724 RepID=UPI0033002F11|nr:acyltransferase [Thiotrichaceae bacterium]
MYLNYINNFRGLAIVFIVAIHALSSTVLVWNNNEVTFQFLYVFLNNSSSYFVFLAGFLFQHLSYKFKFQKYALTKLKYIILPYILMSIPAILEELFVSTDGYFHDYPLYQQVFLYYITGIHMAHFWFIPMIALFYVCAPLLVWLDRHQPRFYWVLPILLLVSIYIPREMTPLHNPVQSFAHFLSIYIFGMYLSHYKQDIIPCLKRYWIGILIGFTSLYLGEMYLRTQLHWFVLADVIQVLKPVVGAPLIAILFYKFDDFLKKSFNFLAEPSFGIYFSHNYFIVFCEIVVRKLSWQIEGNIFTWPLLVVLIVAMSYIFLWVVKRIFGRHSRMLVGY